MSTPSHQEALAYQDALALILEQCGKLPLEDVPLGEGAGRVLGEDILALRDDPVEARSAMDGFALTSAGTRDAGAHPVEFQFDEVVAAGQVPRSQVEGKRAVRIMTGAVIPAGADAVVKQEDTQPADEGRFLVTAPLQPGENIVPVGANLHAQMPLRLAGDTVSPRDVGLFAGQGLTKVRVHCRPRLALLALGDELIEPGLPLEAGKIFVSNLAGLEAECGRWGVHSRSLGIARDDPALIESMIRPCLLDPDRGPHPLGCDVVVTLGGSHQGDFDFAEDVLEQLGSTLHFRRTKIQIGGSTLFASKGDTLLFGLPGTPGASWLAFQVLVRPALMRLAGREQVFRPMVNLPLTDPLKLNPSRRHFVPARINFDGHTATTVTPLTRQMKLSLPDSLLANGLIHCPEGVEGLERSETVSVECLDMMM